MELVQLNVLKDQYSSTLSLPLCDPNSPWNPEFPLGKFLLVGNPDTSECVCLLFMYYNIIFICRHRNNTETTYRTMKCNKKQNCVIWTERLKEHLQVTTAQNIDNCTKHNPKTQR